MKRFATIRFFLPLLVCSLFFSIIPFSDLKAQDDKKIRYFKVRDDKMYIVLARDLSSKLVDSFIWKYNLGDIGLSRFFKTGMSDTLKMMGWQVETKGQTYVISKPMASAKPVTYPAGKVIFTPVPTPDTWREVGGNRVTYGFNRFDKAQEFERKDGLVFFRLEGFENAKRVRLAGNFTNWQHAAFPMTKTGNGWTVQVKLEPGQYYYKFIINDNHWITDPSNRITENDGRGNMNSVYFVPNQRFLLKNHATASNVYLSGTFNNWAKSDIPMNRNGDGWYIEMYIEDGTYSYHYLVDGKKVKSNGNDEHNLAIGKQHLFVLNGYPDAKNVVVTGNFNNWNIEELKMKKEGDRWTLPYVLGPGNYQYKFIVDHQWMIDPGNPMIVHDHHGNQNSYMVIGGNYTFRLKGFDDAKEVSLTGDFTDFSPDGIRMKRVDGAWVAQVYLAKGKHWYNFVVDGKPMKDPANKAWEFDDKKLRWSVIWIDPNNPV